MKIGLINIEPKIFNTAYMQIAQYYKLRGDEVEWWTPLTDRLFDHVYCSSLFDFTDKSEVPKRAVCGGTGFDVTSLLSLAIEQSELDYSIYPDCITSYLWFSRGCTRNCPWCVVPSKEGKIRSVDDGYIKSLNPKGRYLTICDNNFFAAPGWEWAIDYLRSMDTPVDFNQGTDIRTITNHQAWWLAQLRHLRFLRFAWDDSKDEKKVIAGIKRILRYFKPYQLMCYVLIGFSTSEAEDLHRVKTIRDIGIDPFVMPFDKSNMYQKALARWVNHKAIFKKVSWEEYKNRVYKQESAGTGWKKGV